jgi:hypothetical protein
MPGLFFSVWNVFIVCTKWLQMTELLEACLNSRFSLCDEKCWIAGDKNDDAAYQLHQLFLPR